PRGADGRSTLMIFVYKKSPAAQSVLPDAGRVLNKSPAKAIVVVRMLVYIRMMASKGPLR
ncbi:MAG: hypothetical protein VX170_12605, partial [Pseudomonadota bacterium]|nr:hypothetical protein [Pseudomonadota bacterium]